MYIKIKKKWQISENLVTPEKTFFNRRKIIKGLGTAALSALLLPTIAGKTVLAAKRELAKLKAKINLKYSKKDLKLTEEKLFTTYNNFYEFSFGKEAVKDKAKNFKNRPWSVEIAGLVAKPLTLGIDDILKKIPLEERIYRFRCVETWSAVVPWVGFELRKLLALAQPNSKARYVKFTTFFNPKVAEKQKNSFFYDWPYTEGLRLDEANNELAFIAVGLYGKELPPQNGAPLRLVVPWKYGFKSIKSIVKIEFTEKQPKTLWNNAAPQEYGFYANVNPNVSHPRWSQASNKPLGSWIKREPTLEFNGYKDQVASLYKGMDLKKFF